MPSLERIDTHFHIVVDRYVEALKSAGGDPSGKYMLCDETARQESIRLTHVFRLGCSSLVGLGSPKSHG